MSYIRLSLHLLNSGFVEFLEAINVFHQVWEVFNHYLLKSFFCLIFGESHYTFVGVFTLSCGSVKVLCFHSFVVVLQIG